MEESVGAEGSEFKWGKKRGVGGKKKDVQFYESFTYDGDEYNLYDCVLVGDASDPDSSEPFIGKIIKIWEHTKRANNSRQFKLLWFFKPSEIPSYLEGVPDILPNELFLASGEGRGLANVNNVEAIGGKCSVLCISKDKRNVQPSAEEIKSANFVFRRTFDVGSCKVLDTIDDKIAGVDVKFIFNRAGCKKKATAVQKLEADINRNSDSLEPNGPSASGSVSKIEDNSTESSDFKESTYGCIEEEEKGHNKVATETCTHAEERSNKDSGVWEGTAHSKQDSCGAFGSRDNHCDGKAQESVVKKHFTKQKSMPAEERYSNSFEASGSRVNHSKSKEAQVNDARKLLTKQKSMPAEERYSRELNGVDDRPPKKQKLDGSAIVPDGRNTTIFQNSSSNGKKDTGSFKRPKDKVTREEAPPEKTSFIKKRDLGVSVAENKDTKAATEKCLSKKPSSDGKPIKSAEDKMLADVNERKYQVIEVRRRSDAGKSKWFRNLPWEEKSMRDAEKRETLVLLQNLDPTYSSDEVEDIVYSALNEQCEARMIERTSVTVPHIGEALVIFKTREVAERAIGRLDEGCLLLSNGRPLVAAFAKITPPGKPSSFAGHIKLPKTQLRREMREAVATSHCSQQNNLEFDMAMEWCLLQARHEQANEMTYKRQLEEKRSLRIDFKPKLP